MAKIPFVSSGNFSVGVEIEFQLVDPQTYDLTPKGPKLLSQVPPKLQNNFKAEFIQSMLEIATKKCDSIAETEDSINHLCSNLDTLCHSSGCLPYSSSLHPFATLEQRKISDNFRYRQIMDDLQIVGKRLISQGLHIHIGLPDAATTIHVNNSIRQYLPILLAITASSPFYLDEDTGFQSYRSKLFDSLPRSGVPTYLPSWKHYEQYISLLTQSGAIKGIREIWWDVRPHPELGTIEIRICDLQPRLIEIIAITSIVQALVATLAKNKSNHEHDFNIILNNKWQASRYGTKANFIDEQNGTTKTAQIIFDEMLNFIEPQLNAFNSLKYVDTLRDLFDSGNPAERYRLLYKKHQNHAMCMKQVQGEFWL